MPTKRKTSKQRSINEDQPLKKFFSRYSRFQYRPQNSPIAEFDRLCKAYRWEQDGAEENHARYEFNIAMKREFDFLYGSDEKDINNWYKLCHVLRINPAPKTLKECRAAVSRKHVNLVDLVQGFRENITIFRSEKELSEYTLKTKKIFSSEDAADGGVLRALRRHIFFPRESRSGQGQLSQPGNSGHRHPVESIPLEGSNSFQGLRECTWGLVPPLPYHVILATCLQARLARQYTTLMLQPSYPVHHLSNLVLAAAQNNHSHDPA
ncbi:hypothetical protein V8E52_005737 [Russula decolorans]